MTKKITSLLCLVLFTFTACQSKFKHKIETSAHGLVIHKDSTIINIEVVN